ncbi:hypothetical protein HGB24_03220, partial [Candidatus Saccharibacteria bacterium]|nr:hypothetical protein [Candidatus Saccharibacteria bacterium]
MKKRKTKQFDNKQTSLSQVSFSEEVEKLIDPINVGTIHFVQQLNGLLPKKIQRKLMDSSSKKIPFMGFVVEPYASFLCYEIKDEKRASDLLSDNFELVKSAVFEGE